MHLDSFTFNNKSHLHLYSPFITVASELERTDVNNERVDFVWSPECLKSFTPLNPLGKGQRIFMCLI